MSEKWFVAGMDAIVSEYASKREALESVMMSALDTRKHPAIKRVQMGFYEYTSPRNCFSFVTCYIGTEKGLVDQGFTSQLDEWQREAEIPD